MGEFWVGQISIIYIEGGSSQRDKIEFIGLNFGRLKIIGGEMRQQKSIAKKVIILYVLNILRVLSSEETPVTQTMISNYLNDINVPCDRKTVGRNIEYLSKFGYPIKRVRKGYYIDKSELEEIQKKNLFIV